MASRSSLKKTALWCAGIAALALSMTAGIAIWTGFHDDIGHADVGIILANKVLPSGQPSPSLKARLDKGLEMYREGWFPEIIVSGGIGKRHEDEAAVMRDYLTARGVPVTRIHVDSGGKTTYWTARNASRLMREQGWKSAMVITQFYHLYRARMALERFGIHPVYTAHPNVFLIRDLFATFRESVGIYVYQFYNYHPDTPQMVNGH